MSKEEKIEMEGVVVEALKGLKFKVRLDGNNHELVCTMSGKMKTNNIRILPNDRVTVQISPYDLSKGIISWRYK